MPVTPRFTVSQDADFIFVRIRVPYVRISATEMLVENDVFSFYCKPYLLKLSFPCPLVSVEGDGTEADDESGFKGTYDPDDDHGTITAHLPRRTRAKISPTLTS